jgi:hypothetical protein
MKAYRIFYGCNNKEEGPLHVIFNSGISHITKKR